MRFWVQTKAPAGNWVDSIGSTNEFTCIEHAVHMSEQGVQVRVVERTEVSIWEQPTKGDKRESEE